MLMNFEKVKTALENSFNAINWIEDSGISEEKLKKEIESIACSNSSRSIAKAKIFELIATRSRIALDKQDIFQDKLFGYGLMASLRWRWEKEIKQIYLPEESVKINEAWNEFGAYSANGDYGHTSPNTRLLLSVGFSGLLERVNQASQKDGLTEKQNEFYLSCRIVLEAMITVANRLADAIDPYNTDNATALRNIANGAPKNSYEAMQLIILYFFMHEYIGGTRVRTLGRIDLLLSPFYQADIESGKYTKDEIKQMLCFFLFKFWSAKVPYDLPFCLSGIDEDGEDVTSEISYLIVETYDKLNIYSPKIHIRVSDKTPKSFVKSVLDCIRRGNSSFVFVNDNVAIEALMRVGITERDAKNFVPIGCYEPAVWGVEIGCTGNGGVSLPKSIELVLNNGCDLASGKRCGLPLPLPSSYEGFINAVRSQIAYMTEQALDFIIKIERHYKSISPDPILSAQYDHSIEVGTDVLEGGAKYNNSSLYFYSIASLVDSLCAIKYFVFDKKRFTLGEFAEILKANWQGYEKERQIALRLPEKYGNGNKHADALATEFSSFCAELVNNKPNGRGGVFKAALFTIDFCFFAGQRTMATPDGRLAGDPLSKNLCASVGMDRGGITSLINSVTKIDHAAFPTGSVLDFVIHPSAICGEDGLDAFYGILATYFKKGGFAIHGNIFDADVLKKAQTEPEKYKNLQVRVCGWNAYFVNLSKTEQNCFIEQANGAKLK